MKVYTKTGDGGETSLYDGNRATKDLVNFEVIGHIDELSCRIGMLCATILENGTYEGNTTVINNTVRLLRTVQRTLQDFNSHLAIVEETMKKLPGLSESSVEELEARIDEMELVLPKLSKFILPGVNRDDAQAQMCRVQTRAVERAVVGINNSSEKVLVSKLNCGGHTVDLGEFTVPEVMLRYLNRLSDFFFVLARWICLIRGSSDCFVENSE